MDKLQARALIRDILEKPFNREHFIVFIKNLLNRIDETKAFHVRGDVKESFRNVIKTYERIGSYEAPDGKKIDIIIAYLQKSYSIHHARVTQRNFAGKYLSDRGQKDAGLFAFVSPDDEDWRFSLVKMEYKFEQTPTGMMKVKEDFTPARRWSFLVGANERSHTAQSRLVNILAEDDKSPTLEQIEEAFNIETVTKEFFREYRDLFIRTKEALDRVIQHDPNIQADFKNKEVNIVDFSKKLLGQIIFLYFLQKKGWFGVARNAEWGTGSKKFLRELFESKHGAYENFFNDILEPLFYDALSRDRSDIDHWNDHFKSKIPFLNGGLFDPIGNYNWYSTDILFPNELFSNQNKTKEGDTGDGILDIFDRYNFTVKEDEPLEKEVAIDPELLGKAYEKFNAIRPDNFEDYKQALKSGKKGDESKFNKQFGVYYTPREIVHYMCQQSLISYLLTELNSGRVNLEKIGDENLVLFDNKNKKGQLDFIVEHREYPIISKEDIDKLIHHGESVSENEARVESKGKETSTYYYQLPESIRVNAERIDQKLAEITICDPAAGSGAFPVGMMNEIVRARTVLTTFINQKTNRTTYDFKRRCIEHSLYGVDIDPGAVEIAKLRLWLSLVVDEDDIKNIKPLPNLDYKIVCGNSLFGFPEGWGSPIEKEIEILKIDFFSETNPGKKNKLKQKIDKKIKERYANSLKNFGYEVNFDFRTVFSEIFQKKGGFDVVIANPPYDEISDKAQTIYYKSKFSDVLTGHYDLYIFFFRRVFDLAYKGTIVSFITPHTYLQYSQFQGLRRWLYNNSHISEITSRIEGVFESAVVDNVIIMFVVGQASQGDKTVFSEKVIENAALLNQRTKILPQSSFTDSAFDLVAIENAAFINRLSPNTELLGEVVDSTQGITVYAKVQGEKLNHFRETNIDKTCKPVTMGREITKYSQVWSGKYIRYGSWLWCRRDPRFFESPKILLRQTADTLIGTFVEQPMYCIDSVHSLISKSNKPEYNLKYILGILNSQLGAYIYQLLICETGKVFAQVKLIFLRRFPIKCIPQSDQLKIARLVDKVLFMKRHDVDADISALEHEIDEMVYSIYNMTQEEIKFIKNGK